MIVACEYLGILSTLKENEKIARGEVKLTQEEKQKELLEPTTMLYGDIAEKNGIVLAEGV